MKKRGKYEDVEIVKALSIAILNYRNEHGLSREQLAGMIGISSRQLANIEQCNSMCKIEFLEKIIMTTNIIFNSLIKEKV